MRRTSLYSTRGSLPRTLPLFALHACFAGLAVFLVTCGFTGWTSWPMPNAATQDPFAVSYNHAHGAAGLPSAINTTTVHGTPSALNNSDFSHYILALYWPPSVLTKAAQRRALHMIRVRRVVAGFWTHGAWPATYDGGTVRCTHVQYTQTHIYIFCIL